MGTGGGGSASGRAEAKPDALAKKGGDTAWPAEVKGHFQKQRDAKEGAAQDGRVGGTRTRSQDGARGQREGRSRWD